MSTMFIHWIRMKIMVIIILSCHFTTNSRESLHIIGTFDYSYFTAYVHITHINGHKQLWLFVNDRFEFLILQILYIGIFESLRIEQLEIRIYEKRPQARSNVAMATNIFSQCAPSSIFSENLKKSKLSILEIRTFDSKPTISKKKKKKKKRYWAYVDVVLIITLSILATCLVSSNCSVTHVRWREGTFSVLFQWRPAFSALWRCGNSVVSVHHINNFCNTRSNLTKFSGQSPQWLRIVCAKLHVKRLGIDWDINKKTLRRRCHNVGSVLCINNFWSTQSNSAKFTGQLP